jgi:hypothetical protein
MPRYKGEAEPVFSDVRDPVILIPRFLNSKGYNFPEPSYYFILIHTGSLLLQKNGTRMPRYKGQAETIFSDVYPCFKNSTLNGSGELKIMPAPAGIICFLLMQIISTRHFYNLGNIGDFWKNKPVKNYLSDVSVCTMMLIIISYRNLYKHKYQKITVKNKNNSLLCQ